MMDSWMNITGATDAAYTVMDADEGLLTCGRRRCTRTTAGTDMGKMVLAEQTMMVTAMNDRPRCSQTARTALKRSGGEHGGEHGHRRPRDGHGR